MSKLSRALPLPPQFLKVKVRAGARANKLVLKAADSYDIHVREPASEGRANAAVLEMLAQELRLSAGRLWIVKGMHSPSKIIAIRPP